VAKAHLWTLLSKLSWTVFQGLAHGSQRIHAFVEGARKNILLLAKILAHARRSVKILRRNGSRKTIIRSGSVDGLERLTHRKGVQLKE